MNLRKAMSVGLVLFVVIAVMPSMSFAEKPIVLRLAHYHQDNEIVGGEHYLADEVFKRTNGRVKIELYFGETLGKATELLGMVKDGTIDMAAICPGYYPSQLPLWSATNSIPFLMRKGRTVVEVGRKIPAEIQAVQDEFRKWNLKYLNYVMPVLHYAMFSTRPVNSIEDLKGMKVRTYGLYLPQAMKAVGAVGVTMHPAETYEALKRKVIDASLWPMSGGYFMKNYEVAKHIIPWDVQSISGYNHMMNLDTWNRLPEDIQKIILEVEYDNCEHELKRILALDKKCETLMKGQEGVTLNPISEEKRQKWVDANPDFLAQWIEHCEKFGKGDDARKMKARWLEIIKEYDN